MASLVEAAKGAEQRKISVPHDDVVEQFHFQKLTGTSRSCLENRANPSFQTEIGGTFAAHSPFAYGPHPG